MFSTVQLVILYGSQARGTETSGSDIDLAIAGERRFGPEELVEIQTRLSNSSGREIDLIDLNVATGTVFKEALVTGRILLNTDSELYARILSRLVFEEADFEPHRRRLLEEQRKKVLG
ncbi:MAG: nucleotidyltransferase domain-containing protein [Deltaproteobacteria bacterium]|nr:nucleotidyltransferase domain-containing protein [Deltaproteobacteria bacterium]MBI3295400.1 nucleotidyltransferase domain-containing protein [Deltaproteobacteria bacterium]